MVNCIICNKETRRPKFCSSNCWNKGNKIKTREMSRKYRLTEKYRLSQKRHRLTEKYKIWRKRYELTEKCKMSRKRYRDKAINIKWIKLFRGVCPKCNDWGRFRAYYRINLITKHVSLIRIEIAHFRSINGIKKWIRSCSDFNFNRYKLPNINELYPQNNTQDTPKPLESAHNSSYTQGEKA